MQINGTASFNGCDFIENKSPNGGGGALGIYGTGTEEKPLTVSNCKFTN